MAQGNKKAPKLPKKGEGTPDELKRYVEWGIRHESNHRLEMFRRMELNRLYVEGHQWLEQDSDRSRSNDLAGRSPFWKPMQVDRNKWYPMPVQNEMVAPVQNEVARIFGSGSKAYVRPKSADAVIERAAKMATDVLADALERVGWSEKEYLAVRDCVIQGTMILKTSWELDYTKTIQLPKKTACACAGCGCKLAQTKFSWKQSKKLFDKKPELRTKVAEVVEEDPQTHEKGLSYEFQSCPRCGGQRLLPHTATDPTEVDEFGVPLTEPEAIGDIQVRVVSPYDFFPENDGVSTYPDEIGTIREEHVESLDWIRKHYRAGQKVEAESVDAMFRWHRRSNGMVGAVNSEDGMYEEHALVKEFHKEPWVEADEDGNVRANRGRSIVIANGVVLLDDDYMVPSLNNPDVLIPRQKYHWMPWEPRDGELFGIGVAELIISLQDIVNTALSQAEDARHRHGSPKILIQEGADLQFSGFLDTGYQSDVLTYRPSPGDPTPPQLFGNVQMNANWMNEVKMAIDAMSRIPGTMDVEIGEAPPNLSAASAIMYLGEKAAERRKNRIVRFKKLKQNAYSHILQLIHEKYREERMYAVRGRNDKWEVKSFVGTDLKGQNDVIIEDEAYFDMRMFKREVIKDALSAGTITADSAAAKRRINKEWGVPPEINEETNNQVQQAEDEWMRYYAEEGVPAVCLRSDDHQIHFKTHSLSLQQPEAKQWLRDCVWEEVELDLWGWEEQYQKWQQADQMLQQNPIGGGPDPVQPGPNGEIDPNLAQAAQEAYNQRVMIAQQMAMIPKAPELRIQMVQLQMLAPKYSVDATRWALIQKIVRFRAHYEAHYLIAQEQSMAVQAGMPIPAPAGGVETGTGNIPGNPVMAFPGAGSGPGATTSAGDGGVAPGSGGQ